MSTSYSPPPDWKNAPYCGEPIGDTKFIVSKTPIQPNPTLLTQSAVDQQINPNSISDTINSNTNINWNVALEDIWTVRLLSQYQLARGRNVVLIIDLTDGRFYNGKEECATLKIHYINIYLKPNIKKKDKSNPYNNDNENDLNYTYDISDEYLAQFHRILSTYSNTHPNGYIVVHDILGYSLPLYLLTTYLISSLSSSLSFSYLITATSRPPGIYDVNLLKSLEGKYEESLEFDISIIDKPIWVKENQSNYTWSGIGELEHETKKFSEAINRNNDSISGKVINQEEVSKNNNISSITNVSATTHLPGGLRRKKRGADSMSSSSLSLTPSLQSTTNNIVDFLSDPKKSDNETSNDPYAELLRSAGIGRSLATVKPPTSSSSSQQQTLQLSRSSVTSTSANNSSSTSILDSGAGRTSLNSNGGLKRKRKEADDNNVIKSVASTSNTSPHAFNPTKPISSPLFIASSSSSSSSPSSSSSVTDIQTIVKSHSYLVNVKSPHLERILSSFVNLHSRISNHLSISYPASQFSIVELTTKMKSIWDSVKFKSFTSSSTPLLKHASTDRWFVSWWPVCFDCILIVLKEGSFLSFPSSPMSLYHIPHLFFPKRNDSKIRLVDTLCLCELLHDVLPDNTRIARLLLSDCLIFEGENYLLKSCIERSQLIDTEMSNPRAQLPAEVKSKCQLHVRAKKLFPLSKIKSVLSMPLPHPITGVELIQETSLMKLNRWRWERKTGEKRDLDSLGEEELVQSCICIS